MVTTHVCKRRSLYRAYFLAVTLNEALGTEPHRITGRSSSIDNVRFQSNATLRSTNMLLQAFELQPLHYVREHRASLQYV